MSHAPAWGSSLPCNEADHREVAIVVSAKPIGGHLLCVSTDLPDHEDAFSFLILHKSLQNIDEGSANERITTNANDCGLTDTRFGGLEHCLIGKGPRARHNAHLTWRMNVTRHDSNFAFTWLNDARAVRPYNSSLLLRLKSGEDIKHVLSRYTIGYNDDEVEFSIYSFHYCFFGMRGWNIYYRGLAVCFLFGLSYIFENRQPEMRCPSFLGVYSTHHLGAVLNGLQSMECTL